MSEEKSDKFIDISEEVCPMSFVLTKQAIEELEDGQILELVCQAGESMRSISMQMKDEGHLVKDVKKEDDTHFRLKIEKSGLGS